jgi:DNA-binding LacI/PurR family transcriptional regulator
MLKNLKIPVVTISNRLDSEIAHVGIDEFCAMQEATIYAVGRGYNKFLYISPPLRYKSTHNIDTPYQRYNGFLSAISDAKNNNEDIDTIIIKDENYEKVVADYIASNINDRSKVSIICSSDVFVLNIMTYLRKNNIKLPDNYGIMGFDNLSMLKHFYESLTTVSYPMKEVGEIATQTLISKIENRENPNHINLSHKIIKGKTL